MRVTEIFSSIQGESADTGYLTAFVRCTGCNLDCTYCDTRYAREGGREINVDEIVRDLAAAGAVRVTITGGEPLHQSETPALCEALLAAGHTVQVETNGSLPIGTLPAGTRIIMDIKTPGSGMETANDRANLSRLKPGDEIKFVLCSRRDYDWALDLLAGNVLPETVAVHFSPAVPQLRPADLAEWMIADRVNRARLQLQLHRIIWPGEARR